MDRRRCWQHATMARDVISSEIPTDRDTPPHYSDAPEPHHTTTQIAFFNIVVLLSDKLLLTRAKTFYNNGKK